MFASFRIATDDGIQGTSVPLKAVQRDGDKKIVWVKRSEAEIERHEVLIGIEQNGQVQILSGIHPGDKVVSEGGILLAGLNNAQ
jgi:multidrug efflux pump subunit AcrA (membrane-fusion protein)